MKIGIIIQARMGSSRLPGKILKEIDGKSLLELQYKRLIHSEKAEKIIIATSDNKIDDCIEVLCKKLNILYFRGSEDNVLDRFNKAAEYFDLDVIVRSNGDCPFIDSKIIDKLIEIWQLNAPKYDYISNILEDTFPLGMHIEVFTKKALEKTLEENITKEDKEHVTPFIYRNPSKFNLLNIENNTNLSDYRWTIDYQEDFEFVKEIYKRFGVNNSSFGMQDIIKVLEREPQLSMINSFYKKKQSLT